MQIVRSRSILAFAAGLAAPLAAPLTASGQVLRGDRLVYPQGQDISRALTPVEREYLRLHPLGGAMTDAVTAPPTGPLRCVAEYEPMDGIIMAWEGSAGQNNIQAQMARWITTTGNADVYMQCDTQTIQNTATASMTSAGANMSRVRFVRTITDTIWLRDYGPRYCYEGDCRIIVDHQYNRPRPNDDVFPAFFASVKKHGFYELGLNGTQLVHGGGNFHLDAVNRSYATRLTVNENPWFTEPQIVGIWGTYQAVQHTFFTPFPTSIDSTQHLDMWMQVIADDKVIISNWPNAPTSTQAQICDQAAAFMQSRGYTVYRVPAFSVAGVHYTYTNVVMCNDIVLLPSYSNGTVSPSNATALQVYQTALPGKTIIQINCDAIVGSAGVMHCIVMHLPMHRGAAAPGGGLAPTAYVRIPNGGEALTPGSSYTVRWLADDDAEVVSVDLLLSTDGGASYPTVIASGVPHTGSFNWTVPPIDTMRARVKVVARDGPGNTGFDASDASFTIGSPCYANCDASTAPPVLNVLDFSCFLNAFAGGDLYANCDNSTVAPVLNILDFSCFLNRFSAGCP
jgi:agmatine deiminase